MDRPTRVLVVCAVTCVCLTAGCAGGGGTPGPISPPAPSANPTPAISGVTPGSALAGSGNTNVVISGSGFILSSTAQWNGVSLATTYISATSLSATIPASSLASGTVAKLTVVNPSPGGGSSPGVDFTVNNPVPTISSVSPASVVAGSSDVLLGVTGSGFVATTVITWNGTALATTVVSATELKATLTAGMLASTSADQISVQNPGPAGGASAAVNFSVNNPQPVINKINPASVVAGSGDVLLDVSGSGFVAATVVAWNGTPLSTTFVSATELKSTVPMADLSGSAAIQVTVQSPAPGGGTSAAVTFDVNSPVPVINSISPQVVPPGNAATITITGTGFETNSVVLWNGSARPTTMVNTSTLQVALTAGDLQNQGTGALSVSNPGPGAATSATAQLSVTARPVIQSVDVTSPVPGPCPQLQVIITGQNFTFNSTIQANGVSLPVIFYGPNPTTLTNALPLGFVSQPGALSFTVTNPSQRLTSDPFPYPQTSPPALALCASPSPTTVFTGSTFSLTVQPSEVNVSGNGTLTLGSLPAGITSTSNTVALPPTGVTLHLQAASTTAAGTYDLALNGTAGGATAKGDFNFTVSTGAPPSFFFASPQVREVGVPIGGSGSIQFQSIVNSGTSVDFDVTPSVSGLPPGTTATFAPSVFLVGQSVSVTLSAANTAPVTQNAKVTLTGTPSAAVANATASFLADVTQPPGSLSGNRTDFVALAGTPYGGVYDALHNLIFASNPDWNRVDVISNATHKVVKRIPVRSPRGLDITQDNSKVWVQTASQNFYRIDTTSFQTTQFSLPDHSFASSGLPLMFSTDRLLALSDGTLLFYFSDSGGGGGGQLGVFNPQANTLKVILSGPVTALGPPVRSGDGTRVYAANDPGYKTGIEAYDVASSTLTTLGSGAGFFSVLAVNQDGSQLVINSLGGNALYDHNLNVLGTVPGSERGTGPLGGMVFGGGKLYEMGTYDNVALILTMDVTPAPTLKVLGTAPGAFTDLAGGSGASVTPTPFAIDAAGIMLGLQTYGISFDDATFYQNYAAMQPNDDGGIRGTSTFAGPLSGGMVSSLYAFPALTPDVWFGQVRGTASTAQGQLTFTSPASSTPGPANVKFIYPDGEQAMYPQLFSYSTFPEYAVTNGSAPNGGAAAQILGYGLPQDPSEGTLSVGGTAATITTTKGQYPPFSAEPYPSTILSYTLPPGMPGWADVQVRTPIGTGTLSKSVFYAQSVADYASPDSLTAVLVDEKRKQVYLSAGDHIDVFSTSSGQFLAPIQPAAQGAKKQFAGLALTPDGSQLLAADLTDGSLAVINPDSGSSTYIPVAAAGPGINNCEVGPLYVAATSASVDLAFVTFGSLPAPSCPPNGGAYVVNLQTHAVTSSQCGGTGVDATSDGNFVAFGQPCVYSVSNSSYTRGSFPYPLNSDGIAISGDGNVLASNQVLGDVRMNMLGSVAHPIPFYGSPSNSANPSNVLLRPRINAAGSLYYLAYPSFLEIIDIAHATLRMRFALTETVQNTASPMAIDSGGRYVYLITGRGLTVIDLGAAPLSIGHLSQQSAGPGTQIVVRGSGFDSGTTGSVGGIAASVSLTDVNTLALTIPTAPSGPQDLVLTRLDGESYTLENAIVLP